MPDSPTPSPRRAVLLLLLATSFALLLPSLDDFPVADCFSLLVKARDLSVMEIFHPDQTLYANPYYRPAFVLVLKAMQAVAGPAGMLQHVFTAIIHGVTGYLVYLLFLELTRSRRGAVAAALLFLAHPGNLGTVAWTTVAYATMAGMLTAAAFLFLLRFARTASGTQLVLGLLAFGLGLFASETPYLLAPALLCYLLVFRRDPSRVASARTMLTLLALIAVPTLLHWWLLDRRVSSLTIGRNHDPIRLMLWFARTVPQYFAGYVMVDIGPLTLPWVATIWGAIGAILFLVARYLGRGVLYLCLLAILATLPYSLVGHTDRYAYFASIPAAVLLVTALVHFVTRPAATVLLAAALIVLAVQGYRTLDRWGALGDEAEAIYQTLARVKPRLERANQLYLVNLPRFDKWITAYQLGYPWVDPPGSSSVQWDNYFEVGNVRFAAPERSYPADAIVLEYQAGRLVERSPAELTAGKIDYPWFNFPRRLVVAREPTEEAVRDAIAELDGDPRDAVVLEEKPQGFGPTLPAGRVIEQRGNTLEVEADGRTLLVVVGKYLPPDPVAKEAGQTGRFADVVRVEVDGKPMPVLPAFYHFFAVPIPAGKHKVVFSLRGG